LVTDAPTAAGDQPLAQEATPKSLWTIAILGLAPFPIAAGFYGYGPPDAARLAMTALLTWSAVVLSFMAGVRWGLETSRRTLRRGRLVLAFAFGVAAWLPLVTRWRLEPPWILAAYLAAFMLQWLTDHLTPHTAKRFPKLSTAITVAACVSLALALDQAIHTQS